MIPDFDFTKEVGDILKNNSKLTDNIYIGRGEKKEATSLEEYYNTWSSEKSMDDNKLYNEPCPDIYAGTIRKGKVCKKMFIPDERKKMPQRTKTEGKNFFNTVVIVLESPHKDEYADPNFINPALGTTGNNLSKYFQSLIDVVVNQFNSKLKRGSHKIILMESIQYQCSLGIEPLDTEIRDLIFTEIWKQKSIKGDFMDRLSSYNPDVIFNCCTKGNSKPELRDLVQKQIEEYHKKNNNIELYRCNHPSMWKFDISQA